MSIAILFGVRANCACAGFVAFTDARVTIARDLDCTDLRNTQPASLISILEAFSHGTGCYSDDEDNPKECDWKVSVDEDRNIDDGRRLVVTTEDHMTGSGTWNHVLVFGCRSGKVALVFNEDFDYGVDVEEASPDKLVLRFGSDTGAVARCCRVTEERSVYVWNKGDHKYLRERHYTFPAPKP